MNRWKIMKPTVALEELKFKFKLYVAVEKLEPFDAKNKVLCDPLVLIVELDPMCAYRLAQSFKQGRCRQLEAAIHDSPGATYHYTKEVSHYVDKEVIRLIRSSKKFRKYLNSLKDLHDKREAGIDQPPALTSEDYIRKWRRDEIQRIKREEARQKNKDVKHKKEVKKRRYQNV